MIRNFVLWRDGEPVIILPMIILSNPGAVHFVNSIQKFNIMDHAWVTEDADDLSLQNDNFSLSYPQFYAPYHIFTFQSLPFCTQRHKTRRPPMRSDMS